MESVGLEVKCPNCGAALGAAKPGTEYQCQFCGHRSATPALAPPPPPPARPRESRRVAPPRSNRAATFSWIAIVAVALGVTLVFAWPSGCGLFSSSWDSAGPQAVLAKVAGRNVIVGRLRNIGGNDKLYIGAFDGTTGKKLWKVGPFGTYSEGYQQTDFAVSGSHVAVTDFHAKLHIYDLATGSEQHTVPLTDKTNGLGNVWPLDNDRAVVAQADERTTVFDLGTGSATEATKSQARSERNASRAGSYNVGRLPEIPGFKPVRMFENGGWTVVQGQKSPGTPIPMVVGFEPGAKAPKWQLPLPVVDVATVRTNMGEGVPCAFEGSRLVGIYGVGQKAWHLTAIDTRSGTRQWDVTLGEIFAVDSIGGLLLSENRVYVVRMRTLELYDAATGKQVATIGGGLF